MLLMFPISEIYGSVQLAVDFGNYTKVFSILIVSILATPIHEELINVGSGENSSGSTTTARD